MIENTLEHRVDHFRFACIETDAEEHSAGIRILERAAVAVKPRREDNTAGPRRNVFDDFRHVVVEIDRALFITCRNALFVDIYADFVLRHVVSDPFKALSGGFHFSKIVVFVALRSDDGGDHCCYIDHLLVCDRDYPA